MSDRYRCMEEKDYLELETKKAKTWLKEEEGIDAHCEIAKKLYGAYSLMLTRYAMYRNSKDLIKTTIREHETMLFMGNGFNSVLECDRLLARLRGALSLLSAYQQAGACIVSEERRKEITEEYEQVVTVLLEDIAAVLGSKVVIGW
jgi:hypothetical protein